MPLSDPIVEEIHAIREAMAKASNDDLRHLHGRSPRDTAFAMATFLLVAAMASIGCASHRHAGSTSCAPRDDEHVAVLNIHPGEDRQAKILSFDGVPFDAFAGRHAQPGHFRVPLRIGVHEVRVVVPGPCTYYDGRPGPGSSLSTMRFSAKAGTEYEVTMVSIPTQLFSLTEVHVYEVVKAPYEFRAVEQAVTYEPDPASCPNGRGMVR
jgi:hypothetical protein